MSESFVQAIGDDTAYLQVGLRPLRTASPQQLDCTAHIHLYDFARADHAQIRVFSSGGRLLCSQDQGSDIAIDHGPAPSLTAPRRTGFYTEDGYRADAVRLTWHHGRGWLVYARPLSSIEQTVAHIRFFLLLGVVGGTVLALLAGLANAGRAMRPIRELTAVAGEIERTRDPARHVPHPEADDEIAELARTLERMLAALDASRSETESALSRQREFVADASHELRTPLTSVLANLELLSEELSGEQEESARAALRSTRRMRALVSDLLLLARADATHQQPDRPTDLAEVMVEAAAELGANAEDHELTLEPTPAVILGRRDDLHRLILNLLENAVRHTPAGSHILARTLVENGIPKLIVEDDGPGIPPELQRRVFDRFVRGGRDGARGTGLGLAIVRAVADSHGAAVELSAPDGTTGTRFEISFPSPQLDGGEPAVEDHTSTTTGSTIGRRRSRS